MPESAEQIYARVIAGADEDGLLPVPSVAEWDIFPWQSIGGRLATRPLMAPAAEKPREGESGVDCFLCAPDVPGAIWTNERWRLKILRERSGLPLVLMLEPMAHLDFPGLDESMAAEYGVLAVRIAKIIEDLPHIARCHVMRVGDGAEHLHVWFMARPEGLPSLRGSFAIDWDDILPPGPEDVWKADLAAVATALAAYDGTALVE